MRYIVRRRVRLQHFHYLHGTLAEGGKLRQPDSATDLPAGTIDGTVELNQLYVCFRLPRAPILTLFLLVNTLCERS